MALGLVALPLLAASACGGGEFSAAPNTDAGLAGASGSGSSGTGNSGGTQSGSGGSSTGVACQGLEDCNDGDPCTVDRCGPLGECEVAPKCEAPLQCCGGDCGECCDDSDCGDDFECTEDICFAGSAHHVTFSASRRAASLTNKCKQAVSTPLTRSDPNGRVIARSGLFTRENLHAEVPLLSSWTPFLAFGQWWGWSSLGAILWMAFVAPRKKRPRAS